MKQFLIVTLLSLLFLFGYSQNGGQFFENNVIRVNYLGYSNGQHSFTVCNKQDCEARIRTKADQDPAIDIMIKALSCETVYVARPTSINILFRAKAETACVSNPDMGWLEINTSLIVLNLTQNTIITPVRGEDKLKVALNRGILSTEFGSTNFSQQILVYDMSGRVNFRIRTNVKGKSQVDLNLWLNPGLNLIAIDIDCRVPIRFILKYIKD